jgi:hypothetical protein
VKTSTATPSSDFRGAQARRSRHTLRLPVTHLLCYFEVLRVALDRLDGGSTEGNEQRRLLMKMANLHAAEDWRSLVALEREARAVAHAVRGAEPLLASFVFVTLEGDRRLL